jgi:hypothetical protein
VQWLPDVRAAADDDDNDDDDDHDDAHPDDHTRAAFCCGPGRGDDLGNAERSAGNISG